MGMSKHRYSVHILDNHKTENLIHRIIKIACNVCSVHSINNNLLWIKHVFSLLMYFYFLMFLCSLCRQNFPGGILEIFCLGLELCQINSRSNKLYITILLFMSVYRN